MTGVREPVWAYLRQHCNSFATMSADAVFSDIFTLNTVGAMTQELKSLFLIQHENRTICSLCNNTIINSTTIFVVYITYYVSEAILPNSRGLFCELCHQHSGNLSRLQHFVTLPTFLTVELSFNCLDKIFFPLRMEVLSQNYVLKGMVRWFKSSFYSGYKS